MNPSSSPAVVRSVEMGKETSQDVIGNVLSGRKGRLDSCPILASRLPGFRIAREMVVDVEVGFLELGQEIGNFRSHLRLILPQLPALESGRSGVRISAPGER